MEEIWRDIKNYEGLYQVSNLGRVKSLSRYIRHWRGGLLFREGRIMTPRVNKYGYLQLSLNKNGKYKTFTVHQLVAKAFVPNPNKFPAVNHIDENKTNNIVDNLEWCENKYNCNYGTRNKRIKYYQKNDTKKSKPILQYSLTGEFIKEYPSIHEANRQTGIDRKSIMSVCKQIKNHKTAGGYVWKYKKAV